MPKVLAEGPQCGESLKSAGSLGNLPCQKIIGLHRNRVGLRG